MVSTPPPIPPTRLLTRQLEAWPVCLGLDLVFLPRIEAMYTQYGNRFLERVLTQDERTYCLTPVSLKAKVARIAGRIAIKEATVKAMGIGIAMLGNRQGSWWKDIEIQRELRQAPQIRLHGKAKAVGETLGITDWLVSSTHDGDYAQATVIGMRAASFNAGDS